MEVLDNEQKNQNEENEMWQNCERRSKRGRIVGGFIFLVAGALFLLREAGFAIPHWILTWPMLFILIGIFSGIKHKFQNFAWIILIAIGGVFLAQNFFPAFAVGKFIWPIVIMIIGLKMIFRPHNRHRHFRKHWHHRQQWQAASAEWHQKKKDGDYLEVNVVLGSVKRSIINKNFTGGEINCVMAGSEINFANADFTGTVELEVNLVMGGTRLIIPANWVVKSEITAVMGGVDDKRNIIPNMNDADVKVLVLKGTAVMGGIEINSY